jgi:hypothetical protein
MVPSTLTMKATRPSKDSHTFNSPPPGPRRACTVAIPSQSSTAGAPPSKLRWAVPQSRHISLFALPPSQQATGPAVAARLIFGEPSPRPYPRSTVDRCRPQSTDGGLNPPYFPIEKKSRWKFPIDFAVSPLPFLVIKPQSTKIPRRLLVFENNSRYSPSHFQKL